MFSLLTRLWNHIEPRGPRRSTRLMNDFSTTILEISNSKSGSFFKLGAVSDFSTDGDTVCDDT
jgi:hypothetical protein